MSYCCFPLQCYTPLITCNSSMKISNAFKILQIIKLQFNRTVYRFDIAVIAPCHRRYSFVRRAKALDNFFKAISASVISETADKFRAVISLELQLFHVNSAVSQMITNYSYKQTTVESGFLICESQTHQAAAYFSC